MQRSNQTSTGALRDKILNCACKFYKIFIFVLLYLKCDND